LRAPPAQDRAQQAYGATVNGEHASVRLPPSARHRWRSGIYTQQFHELSLPRKILLRMRSWQNYVFFEAL
jgi:hypothetical protein